jgi:protein tyrosine kinase modulator
MPMLQNDRSYMQAAYEADESGLDLSYYYGIVKKRIFYILIPFVLVFAGGSAAALLWPPTYLSEGKILVESQQIPADLVRPTVTASAKERIQVIQQRVMTRDNLLAIMDKYQMFADRRDSWSRTELLDLMRENTLITPVELEQTRGRRASPDELNTIAVSVGFTYHRPDIATKVANDLITLFLNEDARNRTNRAMETTKFLEREVQRLEGELASIETKISEAKRTAISQPDLAQLPQLATLKAELAQKSGVYGKSHPEIKRLKGQIESMEKMPPPAASAKMVQIDNDVIDALLTQRTSIQNNLDGAARKLTAARLGEKLERDQFAERLQVLEQAVPPQKPIKPNRIKLLALAFVGAVMAGVGGVFAVETLDKTIRGSRDLERVADGHLIVALPYISTKAELVRKKSRIALAMVILVVGVLVALAAVHFLVRPLDEVWTILLDRLLAARLLG